MTGGKLSTSQHHSQSSSGPIWTQNLQRLKDFSPSSTFRRVPRPPRGGTDLHRLEQKADQSRGADNPFPRSDLLDEPDERHLVSRAKLRSIVRQTPACSLEARETFESPVLRHLEEQCLCLLHQVRHFQWNGNYPNCRHNNEHATEMIEKYC